MLKGIRTGLSFKALAYTALRRKTLEGFQSPSEADRFWDAYLRRVQKALLADKGRHFSFEEKEYMRKVDEIIAKRRRKERK